MDNEYIKNNMVFLRPTGEETTGPVGQGGIDKNGEIVFFELIGKLDCPKRNNKNLYKRILIQRVFPYVKEPAGGPTICKGGDK